MPSTNALCSEVELKLYRKVPARTKSLPPTSPLCALCGGDVYVCSCARTGNGFPLPGLEEKWSHRAKSRAGGGEQEKEHRAAFLISSGICVCF